MWNFHEKVAIIAALIKLSIKINGIKHGFLEFTIASS